MWKTVLFVNYDAFHNVPLQFHFFLLCICFFLRSPRLEVFINFIFHSFLADVIYDFRCKHDCGVEERRCNETSTIVWRCTTRNKKKKEKKFRPAKKTVLLLLILVQDLELNEQATSWKESWKFSLFPFNPSAELPLNLCNISSAFCAIKIYDTNKETRKNKPHKKCTFTSLPFAHTHMCHKLKLNLATCLVDAIKIQQLFLFWWMQTTKRINNLSKCLYWLYLHFSPLRSSCLHNSYSSISRLD